MKAVIIGNSAAGLEAAKAFRKHDPASSLTMLSREGRDAYSRVLLPYVLRGRLPYEGIFILPEEFYRRHSIAFRQGEVTAVDGAGRSLTLSSGEEIPFDRLLIATGSSPVRPPAEGMDLPGVSNLWTREDLDALLPRVEREGQRIGVIGSGFVALQGAWAACSRGCRVTVLEIADRVMPTVLDPEGSRRMEERMRSEGVAVHTGASVRRVEKLPGGALRLHWNQDSSIEVDQVIVGAGVGCNSGFLSGSGIEFQGPVPVDAYMETNLKGIYAAGDVAAGPTVFGGERMVHALWPTAVEMGRIAGANMAGKEIAYQGSLNMNVTQMFGVTVASVGICDPSRAEASHRLDSGGEDYLNIFYRDSLICGACLVGSAGGVGLLGKLRAALASQVKTGCPPEKLESFLDLRLMGSRVP